MSGVNEIASKGEKPSYAYFYEVDEGIRLEKLSEDELIRLVKYFSYLVDKANALIYEKRISVAKIANPANRQTTGVEQIYNSHLEAQKMAAKVLNSLDL